MFIKGKNFFMNSFKPWKYNEVSRGIIFIVVIRKICGKFSWEKLLINVYELNRNIFAIRGIFIFKEKNEKEKDI